jgi:hypothetical protein
MGKYVELIDKREVLRERDVTALRQSKSLQSLLEESINSCHSYNMKSSASVATLHVERVIKSNETDEDSIRSRFNHYCRYFIIIIAEPVWQKNLSKLCLRFFCMSVSYV